MLKVHGEYSMRYLIGEKKTSDLPSSFIIGNAVCDAPIEIAGKFCEYSLILALNLVNRYLTRMTLIHAFYHSKNVNSLIFDPVSGQEIIYICNYFRPGIAAGIVFTYN